METYIGRNGTFSLMKQLNLEKVYKLILMKHPVSRISISELSGLNKVTVSNCVDFLLQNGVIEEVGVSKPSGGRPPILLDLKKDFGVFIGVEYNTISSVILVTSIDGTILHKSKLPGTMLNPADFVDEAVKVVNLCKEQYGHTRMGVLGMCMAVPNNYNFTTGIVEDIAGRPEWKGFPLRQNLIERLPGLPLYMTRVSTAATLGEIHFGGSDPMQHLAYIYGSWGLVLTIYTAGNIYDGCDGFSGRFGHTVVELNGRRCSCGNQGCLEAYASVHSLIERLYPAEKERIAKDMPHRYELLTRIQEKLQKNDPVVVEAVREMSDYLAIGIYNVINLYNPGQIYIGGFLSTVIDDKMLVYIYDKVLNMLPAHFTKKLHISRSQLAEYASTFGCISDIRNKLIDILVAQEKKA